MEELSKDIKSGMKHCGLGHLRVIKQNKTNYLASQIDITTL
jgi:hypothetical protein